MVSLSNPVHISVQRPRISSLYLIPRRISINHGLLKARGLEARGSSLAFSPLLENEKRCEKGKALGLGLFGLGPNLRQRNSVEFPVVAAAAADAADDGELEIKDGLVRFFFSIYYF